MIKLPVSVLKTLSFFFSLSQSLSFLLLLILLLSEDLLALAKHVAIEDVSSHWVKQEEREDDEAIVVKGEVV